jgi:hypothetical protein
MGLEENEITIHDGILVTYENQGYDKNGKFMYGIEIMKKVDISRDEVESQEEHIGFEAIKISDLPNKTILPVFLKEWVIKYLASHDTKTDANNEA